MIYANEAKMTLLLYQSMSTGTVFIAKYCFLGVILKLASAAYAHPRSSMTKSRDTVGNWYLAPLMLYMFKLLVQFEIVIIIGPADRRRGERRGKKEAGGGAKQP